MGGPWRVLAAYRDFRLLVSAGLISQTGDWILRVGMAYAVYALTGSTLASGNLLMASVLPQVLLGSVAGVFVDRWDHRRTMLAANIVMAVGLAPLLFVRTADQIWIAYVVAAFESCAAAFFAPAESALVPGLVDADDLIPANALNGQNTDASRLIGSALGGVLAGVGGIPALALADAASFGLAAGLLALMRPRPEVAPIGEPSVRSVWRSWRAGIALVARVPALRVLFAVAAISSVGEGIMGTLFAPFVRDVLHGGDAAYGGIMSIQAVGGIAGGIVAAGVGHRFSARSLLGCGALAFGAVDLALFLYPLAGAVLWPAFTLMVLAGLPGALMLAGLMTVFQSVTTDGERGRVFGAAVAVEGGCMLVGIAVAGWLGEVFGVLPVIAVQGAGYLLAGTVVVTLLPRSAGRTDQQPVRPAPAVVSVAGPRATPVR